MTLVIDNFDSFTYNLVQLLGSLGEEVAVYRNNAITKEEGIDLKPDFLIVSPGPGRPEKAGVTIEMIKAFAGRIPILGVCLGHQAMAQAFGGEIVHAARLMHGKNSDIIHDGRTLFSDLPSPFSATRYHSLAVDRKSLPECFEVSAWTEDGEIMGLRHREFEIEGLQFHPESVATPMGRRILRNFLNRTRESRIHIQDVIAKVTREEDLTEEEMRSAMELIMSGETTPAQIAAFLMALKMKGETVTEIASAAAVMRQKATRIAVPKDATVVDTCGTGGDGAHTFNISTVAALVAAGAGVVVAKHGNRSVSSKCGSADVLEALGVNIAIGPDMMSRCIEKTGIGFLFAPALHPAMKHVIGPRREVGVRTIFNILGPLANPAFAHAQVLGVYDRELLPVMAGVLKTLGTSRALVVHGSDGLDEITLTGKTYAVELKDGKTEEMTIDPTDWGLPLCTADEIKGGTAEENARITMDLLEGKEKGPRRNAVLANSAAAIYVAGLSADIASAVPLAEESLDSGNALKVLKSLQQITGAETESFGG